MQRKKISSDSRLTRIGNSVGVILTKKTLETAKLSIGETVEVSVSNGDIIISPKKKRINKNVDAWRAQFKKAIAAGQKPGGEMIKDDINSNFEWEW